MRTSCALAFVAVVAALGASTATATPSVYRTTVTIATHGGTVVGGVVTTAAKGKIGKVNLAKRCRAGRLVDLSPPHGAPHLKVRTDIKGRWSVTLPEVGPGTYKAFVTARGLPDGRSCAEVVVELKIP